MERDAQGVMWKYKQVSAGAEWLIGFAKRKARAQIGLMSWAPDPALIPFHNKQFAKRYVVDGATVLIRGSRSFGQWVVELTLIGNDRRRSYFLEDYESFSAFAPTSWPYFERNLLPQTFAKDAIPLQRPTFLTEAIQRMLAVKRWELVWEIINGNFNTSGAYLKAGWETSTIGTDVLVVDLDYIRTNYPEQPPEVNPWSDAFYEALYALLDPVKGPLATFNGVIFRDIPGEVLAVPPPTASGPPISLSSACDAVPVPLLEAPPASFTGTAYSEIFLATPPVRDADIQLIYFRYSTSMTSAEATHAGYTSPPPPNVGYFYLSAYSLSRTYFRRTLRRRVDSLTIIEDVELPSSAVLATLDTNYYLGTQDPSDTLPGTYASISPFFEWTTPAAARPQSTTPTARRVPESSSTRESAGTRAWVPSAIFSVPAQGNLPLGVSDFVPLNVGQQSSASWTWPAAGMELGRFTDRVSKIRYTLDSGGEYRVLRLPDYPAETNAEVLFTETRPFYAGALPFFGTQTCYTNRSFTRSYDTYTYTIPGTPPELGTGVGVNHTEVGTLRCVLDGDLPYVQQQAPALFASPSISGAVIVGREERQVLYMPERGSVRIYPYEQMKYAEREALRQDWLAATTAEARTTAMAELLATYQLIYQTGVLTPELIIGADDDTYSTLLI